MSVRRGKYSYDHRKSSKETVKFFPDIVPQSICAELAGVSNNAVYLAIKRGDIRVYDVFGRKWVSYMEFMGYAYPGS